MSAGFTDYRHESPYLVQPDIFGKYLGLRKLNVSLRLMFALPITILNSYISFFWNSLDLKLSILGFIVGFSLHDLLNFQQYIKDAPLLFCDESLLQDVGLRV